MPETQDNNPTTQKAGLLNEQSLTQDQIINERERLAFKSYVKDQNAEVPSNFKDVDTWFNALKSAQGEYTKSRQEVSNLRNKYEPTDSSSSFITAPSIVDTKEASPVEYIELNNQMRIPTKEVATQVPQQSAATAADWKAWTLQYALHSTLDKETIKSIQDKTNLPESIINEYMTGQKAKIDIAYSKASDLIGGKEKMDKVFKWASQTLPQVEQDNINATLATPSWEIALLGLTAKYDKNNFSRVTEEPKQSNPLTRVSVQETISPQKGYMSRREFGVDRNNPRYGSDPAFRGYVESRMLLTDFNTIGS